MDEILLVEGAERLRDVYESSPMQEIRKNTSVTGGKMFFSYAETIDNYSEFAAFLNEMIKPRHNNNKGVTEQEPVLCKEACELFPDKIISKK